jgi:PKHD-type hydroxylase
MLLEIADVLTPKELEECRSIVTRAAWTDGRITAGTQSERTKNNLQLPEQSPAAAEAGKIVLGALGRNALFFTAALPKRIFPPLFNCYTGGTNAFGDHVDNAMRVHSVTNERVRTDLAVTLFLSAPDEYDGGELVIEDVYGAHSVKLGAGDLVLYPASSVHRVEPVTRGARIASFFWLESMIRDAGQRRMLFDLDMAILELRAAGGDTAPVVRLTGCYHNLLRMWGES